MLLSYQNVTIEREEQTLFAGLDLSVDEGEFLYLIGGVGSGKTSLLKTIYGELPIATASEARVLDFDLMRLRRRQLPMLRRQLGIVFQDFRLLHDRTVADNLNFVLRATGWRDRQAMAERVESVLRLVGMEGKGYRRPNTLSGGEQQRAVIARALLGRPRLILADEPTGNLDVRTAHEVVALLHSICQVQHTAVIMATHSLHFLDEFPGRVLSVDRSVADFVRGKGNAGRGDGQDYAAEEDGTSAEVEPAADVTEGDTPDQSTRADGAEEGAPRP